jgi:decaprenyl-phosphate phosphoribosyltransferase
MFIIWVKAIRARQWVKNLLLFIPAVLAGKTNVNEYFHLFLGFILFSLLASGGYLLNDIRDKLSDSFHPIKRNRPISSGLIGELNAKIVAYAFIGFSLILGWIWFKEKAFYLLFYFLLNMFYANYLKQQRFLDVLVLSSFYLIRIFFGGSILELSLTGWFVGTFTFASLGLGLSKRYMELVLVKQEKSSGRSYAKEDIVWLLPLMYSTVLVAVLFLNIHAFFVLNVTESWFYAVLNLLSFGIILFYFDQIKDKTDDPVERILNNRWLLFFVGVMVVLYIGMMF